MHTLACRLHNPWPQLKELADSINLDAVDDVTHRHIPYGEGLQAICIAPQISAVLISLTGLWHTEMVPGPHASMVRSLCCAAVILLKGAQKWCSEHSSKLPQNAKEKAAFKQMLKSWQRSAEGIPADVSICSPDLLPSIQALPLHMSRCCCQMSSNASYMHAAKQWEPILLLQEENFDEALSNAHKLFSPPSIRACRPDYIPKWSMRHEHEILTTWFLPCCGE